MELTLLNSPAGGYEPGDTLSGEVRYNIAAQQENIRDVRLHLDGSVLVHPFKLKYEAHRSKITVLEESQTPFQGPFTLKRQLLVWPFAFVLPEASSTGDSLVPLPPSINHQFREGVQIRVEYNLTATIRLGSDHRSAKQASRVVLVRHSPNPAELEHGGYALSFPPATLQTNDLAQRILSRFRGSSRKSRTSSHVSHESLQLEMTMPLTLSSKRKDAVTCCLTGHVGTGDGSYDTTVVLDAIEFVLRSRLKWKDLLEDVRHVGTAIMRPGTELSTDGQPAVLPDTLHLQDFIRNGEILASLQSWNSVVPEISLNFTVTVTAILRHKTSGRRIESTATLPVVIIDSNAKHTLPPAYERLDVVEEVVPPSYEAAASS